MIPTDPRQPFVLSLFPGIGILDSAFEAEGFTVVRGPDLLWGGDIKKFHPPAGRFDGVIGGPPCQAFSALRHLVKATGHTLRYGNLIPEFERCVSEAAPTWFLMENVRGAPIPAVDGYQLDPFLYNARWLGMEQSRLHRFTFGHLAGARMKPHLEFEVFENIDWSRRVLASGGYVPCQLAGGNHVQAGDPRPLKETAAARRFNGGRLPHEPNRPNQRMSLLGRKDTKYFNEARRLQGLPDDWDVPGFTVASKIMVLGVAVPYPMGRALARAVRCALDLPATAQKAGTV